MSKADELDETAYANTLDILKKLLEDMNAKIDNIEKNTKPRYTKPNIDKDATYDNRNNVHLAKLNNREILQPKQTTYEIRLLQNRI